MKNYLNSINRQARWFFFAVLSMVLLCACTVETEAATSTPPGDPQVQQESQESVSIHAVDGGAKYYDRFSPTLSTASDYFPIGVWFESLQDPMDRDRDRSILINTYVELVPGFDLNLLEPDAFALSGDRRAKANGFVLTDEVDMWAGAGWGLHRAVSPGEGDTCANSGEKCGFTILRELASNFPSTALLYTNFGKGVTFWNSDIDSATFVNDFSSIVSADNYWFTDPNICSQREGGQKLAEPRDLQTNECRIASNYGWTVNRLRELVRPAGSKPVWAFIEVGHPFSEEAAPTISLDEIRAAVWSSLINNARGIVYFNHSFAGPCASQHVLRDCGDELREGVASVNRQITKLSPVLNSPYLQGATEAKGEIDASTRLFEGKIYLFAGSTAEKRQSVEFSVRCAGDGMVNVIDEKRKIEMKNGKFKDNFAGSNDVHLYELGTSTCKF